LVTAASGALAAVLTVAVLVAAGSRLSAGPHGGAEATAVTVRVPHELVRFDTPVVTGTVVARSGKMIQTVDEEWARQLRDTGYWAKQRSGGSGSASWSFGSSGSAPKANQLGMGWPDNLSPFGSRGFPPGYRGWGQSTGTYRTVCVRLCDGYYWPVSFATSRSNFERDAIRCEASCAGAKLYVYRNPGEEVDDMQDLKGQLYTKLPNAFLYRTKYDAACKCQPHPWEEASRLRHRIYALEAASRRGDMVAGAELKVIRDNARKSRSTRRAAADDARGGQDASLVDASTTEVLDLDPALANALGQPFQSPAKAKKTSSSGSNSASNPDHASGMRNSWATVV
jgi:hypothetical protein